MSVFGKKVVGQYQVDIGHNPPVIEAKDPVNFDFSLLLTETGKGADFTDIWVRIVQGKKTVFATGVHRPLFGKPTLIHTFPEGGEYELAARFQQDGDALTETSFPLRVGETKTEGGFPSAVWLAGALAAGLALGFAASVVLDFLRRKTKQTKKYRQIEKGR